MLDQGFEQAIRAIIAQTAPLSHRQTALFSATWPQSIQQLAQEFLNNPIKVRTEAETDRQTGRQGAERVARTSRRPTESRGSQVV